MNPLQEIDAEIATRRAILATLESLRARIGTTPAPEGAKPGKAVAPAADRYALLRRRLVRLLADGPRQTRELRASLDASRHELYRALAHVWFERTASANGYRLTPEGRGQTTDQEKGQSPGAGGSRPI